jgi:2-dehydropantoate 2-reductase
MESATSTSSERGMDRDPTSETVAVVGLGGVGGVAAGSLLHAGRRVVGCARRPLDRLTLERPEGDVAVALRTLTDPDKAEPVDWVLLCVKTYATASAAPWLERLCAPGTRIMVLQNGIDHVARVGPFAKGADVAPAVVYYNGERVSPDRFRLRHVAANDLAVANDEIGRAFARLLDGTSLQVLLSDDFAALLWRKLLINAIANPITALTRQRQKVLRRDGIRALCMAVLDEATAVARAEGVRLESEEAAKTLATLLTYPEGAGSSMYFDCLASRPLEIEALNGAIVAVGERHRIATPVNRALVALLSAISDAAAAGAGQADA